MDRFLFRKVIVLSFLLSMGITLFTACSNEEENNNMNSKKKIEKRKQGEFVLSYNYGNSFQSIWKTTSIEDSVLWTQYYHSNPITDASLFLDKSLLDNISISIENEKDAVFKLKGSGENTMTLCNIKDIDDGICFDVIDKGKMTLFIQYDNLNRDNFIEALTKYNLGYQSYIKYKNNLPIYPIIKGIEIILVLVATAISCEEDKQRECEKRIADGVRRCKAQKKDSRLVGPCNVECVDKKK